MRSVHIKFPSRLAVFCVEMPHGGLKWNMFLVRVSMHLCAGSSKVKTGYFVPPNEG